MTVLRVVRVQVPAGRPDASTVRRILVFEIDAITMALVAGSGRGRGAPGD